MPGEFGPSPDEEHDAAIGAYPALASLAATTFNNVTVQHFLFWLFHGMKAYADGVGGRVRGDVLADAANKFNALNSQLAQIAGGTGSTDALLVPLDDLAASLRVLADQALLHAPDADADSIDNLSVTLDDAAQRAEKLQQPLADALDFDLPGLMAGVEGAFVGEAGEWQRRLPAMFKALLAALYTVGPVVGPALIAEALEHFPRVAARFQEYGQVAAEHMANGVNALHRPLEAVIETSAGAILRELRDEMFNLGPTSPDNVDGAAARLLSIAGGFGMSAHLVAVAAEKIVGTKHLGFPQLAAYLADAASFGRISASSVGAQIDAALKAPATRRALAQFRSELPDAGSFVEMVYDRAVPDFELLNYYRERGWTEETVGRQSKAMFRKASPRELAMVFEDGEPDTAWALRMLQRGGFNDEDADRLLRGVLTRASKTLRQAFVSAVLNNADEGIYSAEQAAGYLREFGLSESSVQTNLTITAHKRVHTEVTERLAALESAHLMGATTDEEFQASLAALGLDERAQRHHLSVARIKRQTKLFTTSTARDQASENRARTEATNAALAAFRRFTLDEDGLRQTLTALGVNDDEVESLVQLAAVQRTPAPRLEQVLAPGAEAAKARKVQADAVLELQKRGTVTQGDATERLVALGMDRGLAIQETALVAARLVKPPDVVKPPSVTELQRDRQRAATTGAVDLFRAGLIDQGLLTTRLTSAGYDGATAAAIAQREADGLAADRARKARQLADAEFRKEQQRVSDEAVTAFRAGLLDAAGLEQTLVAAGMTSTVATATVEREQNVAASRDATQAESQAKADAARILKADQDAAVLAFRADILTADELEDELVFVGTAPTLAASLRRKEEARKLATPKSSAATAPGA